MEPSLHNAYESLAAAFTAHFPPQLPGPRTIGREAEFPVVDQAGRAADIAQLWPLLLHSAESAETNERSSPTPHSASLSPLKVKRDAVITDLIVGLDGAAYSYALEVGKGTIELNVGPCATLFELENLFRTALERLVHAAAQLGWRVLGYGVQPLSPPTRALLSPKQRYHALADIMGADWIWYTVTASDQAHVDISRDEAVALLNFGNLIAPVVVALCANSPVVAGALTRDCSAREGRMIDAPYGRRHGMIARPYADLTDFVATLSRMTSLLRRRRERLLPDGRPFADVLRADYRMDSDEWIVDHDETGRRPPVTDHCFSAFLLHDHYIWHNARLRTAYATVELRPACQQPPHEPMAAAALYLGLVEGHRQITQYVQNALSPPPYSLSAIPSPLSPLSACWPRMKQYHRQAVRAGLAAPEPVPRFLAEILALAQIALARRGFGEERLLTPLWQRLDQKENPAQQARRIFAEHGVERLIERSAIHPV